MMNGRKFDALMKMYPMEWIAEESGHNADALFDWEQATVIEPAWKLLVGNKALLPMLWEMFPNHPNLLPAYFIDPKE